MGKSTIEYVTHVWNPTQGCTPKSKGCENCWARANLNRWQQVLTPAMHPNRLGDPPKEKKPARWLTCSLGDLFHEQIPFEYISRVFDVIAACPQHRFMVLTKWAERMQEYYMTVGQEHLTLSTNICLGVSVEDMETAVERIGCLKSAPAAWRWVSYEPAIENIDWAQIPDCFDMLVMGGEQYGKPSRRMNVAWVDEAGEMCKAREVAFWFKQWGDNLPVDNAMALDLPKQLCEGVKLPHEKEGK